jgi:hypothetical protein
MKINAISLWSTGTNGKLELICDNDTTNTVVSIINNKHVPNTITKTFDEPLELDAIGVKSLSAGTAWIYLA